MTTQADDIGSWRPLWPPLYMILHLPTGLCGGFVGVTLGYVLTHHGFGVGAVASLISLGLLPTTWRFLIGPAIDLTLTPTRWYVIATGLLAASVAAFAFVPLKLEYFPLFAALSLGMGVLSNVAGAAVVAAMAVITPPGQRGAVGGWTQAGGLSGSGLGGGAGLWVATHAPGGVASASLMLAVVVLCCMTPLLWLRTPRRDPGEGVMAKAADLGRGMWTFARTRTGVLAMLAGTIPAALNASGSLLPAVAGDWKASAGLVAAVTGVLAGLISLPGCVLGGYLCTRWSARTVYMCGALACAAGQIAMALAPHTPAAFAGFILGNTLVQGVAWGSVTAVIFERLGPDAAATLGGALGSLCNLPVAVMVVIVGRVQTSHGSTAMLLTEATVAVLAVTAYAALATLWRPGSDSALQAAPA